MKHLYSATTFVFFTFLAFPSVGQEDRRISGTFENSGFDEFVRQVESQTPYYFDFYPARFDSLKGTGQFVNADLSGILDSLFLYSDYHYFVDPDDKVFVTRGRQIRTEFPVGFFDIRPPQGDLDI